MKINNMEVFETYIEEKDITIVVRELSSSFQVVGWYYGIPYELDTIMAVDHFNESERRTGYEHSYRVTDATAICTGGGIYVFMGRFADGSWFVADSDNYDITRVDADPRKEDFDTVLGWDEENENYWMEDHCSEYVYPTRLVFMDICKWVLDNKPDGNYLPSEIQALHDTLKTREGLE